ncbi:nitrate reductase molybdenum cofactor assembly chaperone [Rhodoferax sp.]|uniref:nitrate reductase molybdenum cofactor assembly chaperone n=1 Tax=Rhodoferax sp. TaxID=50421 RepID=UPI002638D412|nr:nitrate reductase molybdenum cofactor assembly chaperone [Rhodoferax sp.]MDD2924996.1 nitrate reductase molybdenum cofactor assembly chaperone [Rhodoferax sp.]
MALFSSNITGAARSLRVLARLLSYPDGQLRADLADMHAALQSEHVLSAARRAELTALMNTLAHGDSLAHEAEYVDLFDRGRATALHLFEHVHGDSRDRGPAMIDLAQTYEKAGLFLAEGELPDYLPVVLEFVSTQPPAEARAFLGEMAHIFNAIFHALQQRNSAYASVLGALLELSGEKAHPVKLIPDEPLDSAWEEPVVFDGCSVKGQSKPDQTQPIHFVKTDAASRKPAAASAGVTP